MSQIIDSDRRCPFDSKRMLLEIGQDDTDGGSGWTRMVHMCIHCDYREIDENWARPKLVLVQGGRSSAERLKAQRLGEVIPLFIDPTPFPVGEEVFGA